MGIRVRDPTGGLQRQISVPRSKRVGFMLSSGEGERGDAFAGRRKRIVQQRFERVGCPTAKHGLHRSFQGPIHARKVTLGDLLAEQGFDRGGQGGLMGPSSSFACAGQAPMARLLRVPTTTREGPPFCQTVAA